MFVQLDRELQAEVGLPRTHFEILWLLYRAPGQATRMSDLAAATGSKPSSVSYAVSRLEQAGQVRRELCVEDRRGWYAVLTQAGRERLRLAAPRYAEMVRRYFFQPLTDQQLEAMTVASEHILPALERAGSSVFMVDGGEGDVPSGFQG